MYRRRPGRRPRSRGCAAGKYGHGADHRDETGPGRGSNGHRRSIHRLNALPLTAIITVRDMKAKILLAPIVAGFIGISLLAVPMLVVIHDAA